MLHGFHIIYSYTKRSAKRYLFNMKKVTKSHSELCSSAASMSKKLLLLTNKTWLQATWGQEILNKMLSWLYLFLLFFCVPLLRCVRAFGVRCPAISGNGVKHLSLSLHWQGLSHDSAWGSELIILNFLYYGKMSCRENTLKAKGF